jgi:hypothetical protein
MALLITMCSTASDDLQQRIRYGQSVAIGYVSPAFVVIPGG